MDKFFAPSPGNSGGERGPEEEEEVAVTGERQGATLVKIGFFEVNPVTKTGKRRGQDLMDSPLNASNCLKLPVRALYDVRSNAHPYNRSIEDSSTA